MSSLERSVSNVVSTSTKKFDNGERRLSNEQSRLSFKEEGLLTEDEIALSYHDFVGDGFSRLPSQKTSVSGSPTTQT